MTLIVSASRKSFSPLIFLLLLTLALPSNAQENSGWHISPMLINLGVGDERPLQALDASGHPLAASDWSVDSSELAEIRQESGHVALFAKGAGVVRVTTLVQGSALTAEIKIWSLQPGMTIGLHWVVPSTGRELGALQAAPSIGGGPDLFTLDQNDQGTYLRALTNRGIQLWMLRLASKDGKAEIMCGDNYGGAIITVARANAYTLYVAGKDGKLKWQHTFAGIRKGYAINASNLIHLLNQSADGSSAVLSAWDGTSGVEKFELKLPLSHETEVNLRKSGDAFICAPGRSVSRASRTETSRVFVNTDGDAYAAFTVKVHTLRADKCTAESVLEPQKVHISREDQLILWRIQEDGSHRDTIVETSKQSSVSAAVPESDVLPTGDIIPDGFGGILLSIRVRSKSATQKVSERFDEYVYRVTEEGTLAYKFLLPRYVGELDDDMVLGEQDLGFASRGGTLVAFNVKDGTEVWRWNSGILEVKIIMATAGGGCAVDTPQGLVLVEEGIKKKVLAPRGSDLYGPGLFIQDDPHGLAMVGEGFKLD